MGSVNCTIVGQKGRGGSDYKTNAQYMGYRGTYSDDYVLSFTTGDFTGVCKSITFNIRCGNTSISGTRTYRFALLSSDANAIGATSDTNYYYCQYGVPTDVTEPNQIIKGTIAWSDIGKDSIKTLTIATTALRSNTTYYLVLWAYSSEPSMITISQTIHHSVILEYDDGLIYIDTGSGLEAYQCYIDNGTGWDLYLPYVDTGTGWDQCL